MIAPKRRCPPLRAAGIGTNSIHWRDNSSPSPLAQPKRCLVATRPLELAVQSLHDHGITSTRARLEIAFEILKRVLNTSPAGATLRLDNFSSRTEAGRIIHALAACNLILCTDMGMCTPRDWDVRNAKPRRWLPTPQLIAADVSDRGHVNHLEFLRGKTRPRNFEPPVVSLVDGADTYLDPRVIAMMKNGTGLAFSHSIAAQLLQNLPAPQRAKLMTCARMSAGNVPSVIRPSWRQSERSWRLNAFSPAALSLPKILRAALHSVDGLRLWSLDFSSFETRILFGLADVEAPAGDIYEDIANRISETSGVRFQRNEVKAALNPLLHGQTSGNIIYDPNLTRSERNAILHRRELVLSALPQGARHTISQLQTAEARTRLQRRGAVIFTECWQRSVLELGVGVGLPIHDGWILAADPGRALGAHNIFEKTGSEIAKGVMLGALQELN